MFPKSMMLPWLEDPPPLAPARGATTSLIGSCEKCSGAPCGCQGRGQANR